MIQIKVSINYITLDIYPCTLLIDICIICRYCGTGYKYTIAMKSKFNQLHQSLNERQKILIDKLNKIANDKMEKLSNESNKLKQQQIDAQKVKCLIYK